MRRVNSLFKILVVGVISFCIPFGQVYADSGIRPIVQDDREVLESILTRSFQVVIGRFDHTNVNDIDTLKPGESVEVAFFIEHHVKGGDSSIESIKVPVPYELFVLGTEEGREKFVAMMLLHRQQLSIKENAFLRGELSEAEWGLYKDKWSKEDRAQLHQHLLFSEIKRGLDMSFNPDLRYVLFLKNDFDGEHIDWKSTIAQRTFSLGYGSFADLLLEEWK